MFKDKKAADDLSFELRTKTLDTVRYLLDYPDRFVNADKFFLDMSEKWQKIGYNYQKTTKKWAKSRKNIELCVCSIVLNNQLGYDAYGLCKTCGDSTWFDLSDTARVGWPTCMACSTRNPLFLEECLGEFNYAAHVSYNRQAS
jgi:hypothetical protein